MCAAISSHLEGRGGCLRAATAVCGDGVLDFGEACDDGNTAGGNGLALTPTLTLTLTVILW